MASTLNPVQLVLGDEELLVDRAIAAIIAAARGVDPQAEVTKQAVSELTVGEFAELTGPSLFGDARVMVVQSAQDVGKDLADALVEYAAEPTDGATVIVVHSGGGRAKAAKDLPLALRKAGAQVTDCPKLTKAVQRENFVKAEIAAVGGKIDRSALASLVESVGSDLRDLAAAARQLATDSTGVITVETVRQYHNGRAEVTGFAVAEQAVQGDAAAALEALRWAQQLGVPAVLIADALADAVRTVAKVAGAPRVDPDRLVRELGMPAWKIRKAMGQARGWQLRGLGKAMQIAATVNGEVKGQAADANYALERAVLGVAQAKTLA